jgi:hypothetical protein
VTASRQEDFDAAHRNLLAVKSSIVHYAILFGGSCPLCSDLASSLTPII